MKLLLWVLIVAGLAGLGFAWWGLHTVQARAQFDEMDGLYPWFAGVAGVAILIIVAVLQCVLAWRGGGKR